MGHLRAPEDLAGETERPVSDRSLVPSKALRIGSVLVIILIAAFLTAQTPPLGPRFTGTHWLFTYEFGFIKRGLAGTLLSPVFSLESFQDLVTLSLVVSVITFTAFVSWIFSPVWRAGLPPYLCLWLILALLHSGSLQNFGFDLLRFDQLILWILFAVLAVTARAGPHMSTAAVGVLGGVSLLIHEAALFTAVPVMLGALLVRISMTSPGSGRKRVVGLGVLFTGLTWLIGVFGRLPMTSEEYFAHLQARVQFDVEPLSVAVLTRSLGENVEMALDHLTLGIVWEGHLLLAVLMLPTAIVVFGLWRDVANRLDPPLPRSIGVLFLAVFGPLALYGLGHDFFRWWALTTVNAFVVLSWLCRIRPDCGQVIEQGIRSRRGWVITAIVLSILLGPMGVYMGFPAPIWRTLGATSVSVLQ